MQESFRWIGKSNDGKIVTLKLFDGNFNFPFMKDSSNIPNNPEFIRTAAVLDTETSGLNKSTDQIIEIGIRTFLFNKNTGEILTTLDSYQALQDPGFPISDEVQRITGLTNYILHNQNINWTTVDEILSTADIIIAHNAAFDRPFVDKKSKISQEKPWACSIKQINWGENGYNSSKLELLSIYHGFFTDAHRALNDADALLYLLSMKSQTTNKPYLNELLTNARRQLVKMFATNAPFETKDTLKERGYSWDNLNKVWSKVIFIEEKNDEVKWLETAIYKGNFKGQCQDIPLNSNFKS